MTRDAASDPPGDPAPTRRPVDLDALVEQARERARRLRASDDVDADIDERLAEEYAVVASRPRGLGGARAAVDELRAAVPPGLEGISLPGRVPGAVATRKAIGRLVRPQLLGVFEQLRDLHDETVRALADLVEVLAALHDETLTAVDALADRIADLERWAALPGAVPLVSGVARLPASRHGELDTLADLSLVVVDDDGTDPGTVVGAAHRALRAGGRLVVGSDRAEEFRRAALEAGFVRARVETLWGPEPLARPADDELAGALADLYERVDHLAAASGLRRLVAVR